MRVVRVSAWPRRTSLRPTQAQGLSARSPDRRPALDHLRSCVHAVWLGGYAQDLSLAAVAVTLIAFSNADWFTLPYDRAGLVRDQRVHDRAWDARAPARGADRAPYLVAGDPAASDRMDRGSPLPAVRAARPARGRRQGRATRTSAHRRTSESAIPGG
jgi:hypothetical protein